VFTPSLDLFRPFLRLIYILNLDTVRTDNLLLHPLPRLDLRCPTRMTSKMNTKTATRKEARKRYGWPQPPYATTQ
jgi:hypothetical protein